MLMHCVLGWPLVARDGMASVGWLSGSEIDFTLIPSCRENRKKYKQKLEFNVAHYFIT